MQIRLEKLRRNLSRSNLALATCSFLFSAVVCGLAGELYLRLSVPWHFLRPSSIPGLPYELTPNYKATYLGVEYRHNRFGLRGEDFPLEKPDGEYRILFVGDSIVQGAYVREEEGVAEQLQARWRQRSGYENTRVINAGVTSYDLKRYLTFYQHKGAKFEPDVVLIGLFMNDHHPYLSEGILQATERRPRWWERSYLLNRLITGFPVFEAFMLRPAEPVSREIVERLSTFSLDPGSASALGRFAEQRNYSLAQIVQEYLPTLYDLEAWRRIEEPFREFDRLVREKRARLMVVIFPMEFQLAEGFSYGQPQKLISEIGDSLGIPVLDSTPVLRSLQRRLGRSIYHRNGDMIHFDAQGHAAVAEAIFNHQQALIPERRVHRHHKRLIGRRFAPALGDPGRQP